MPLVTVGLWFCFLGRGPGGGFGKRRVLGLN